MDALPLLVAKAAVSGVLVALVNLVAQRNPTLAGLIVAFPVITLLSTLWLVVDRAPGGAIDAFLAAVLWGLIPTFVFVGAAVAVLRGGGSLPAALAVAAVAWLAATLLVQWSGVVGRVTG